MLLDELIIIKEIILDLEESTKCSKFSILQSLIETKYVNYIKKCNREDIEFLLF